MTFHERTALTTATIALTVCEGRHSNTPHNTAEIANAHALVRLPDLAGQPVDHSMCANIEAVIVVRTPLGHFHSTLRKVLFEYLSHIGRLRIP